MIFSRALITSLAATGLLAACGGGETPDFTNSEKTVENPAPSTNTSTDTSAAPEATPTAAPAETVDTPSFAGLPEPYNAADYARGRRTFKLCQSCHTLNEGGANLVGPNLYGIFGREIGSVEGFTYSSAVENADFTWTPEKLEEWLTSPRDFLPGNKMSFAGVRKPEDRHAVIAYIMLETGSTGSDE